MLLQTLEEEGVEAAERLLSHLGNYYLTSIEANRCLFSVLNQTQHITQMSEGFVGRTFVARLLRVPDVVVRFDHVQSALENCKDVQIPKLLMNALGEEKLEELLSWMKSPCALMRWCADFAEISRPFGEIPPPFSDIWRPVVRDLLAGKCNQACVELGPCLRCSFRCSSVEIHQRVWTIANFPEFEAKLEEVLLPEHLNRLKLHCYECGAIACRVMIEYFPHLEQAALCGDVTSFGRLAAWFPCSLLLSLSLALLLAAQKGQHNVVQTAIKHGVGTSHCPAAFFVALRSRNLELAKILLPRALPELNDAQREEASALASFSSSLKKELVWNCAWKQRQRVRAIIQHVAGFFSCRETSRFVRTCKGANSPGELIWETQLRAQHPLASDIAQLEGLSQKALLAWVRHALCHPTTKPLPSFVMALFTHSNSPTPAQSLPPSLPYSLSPIQLIAHICYLWNLQLRDDFCRYVDFVTEHPELFEQTHCADACLVVPDRGVYDRLSLVLSSLASSFKREPWLLQSIAAFRERRWPELLNLLQNFSVPLPIYSAMRCVAHFYAKQLEECEQWGKKAIDVEVAKRFVARSFIIRGQAEKARELLCECNRSLPEVILELELIRCMRDKQVSKEFLSITQEPLFHKYRWDWSGTVDFVKQQLAIHEVV